MEERRYIDKICDEDTGDVVGYLHTTHVITDPIDLNTIDISTAPLTDYSGVEHVELDLDLPNGLCTINADGSCSIEFKE